MNLATIIVIAVGLSMDAFAVSIVSGSLYKQKHLKTALLLAISFGSFQALMPLIGYSAAINFNHYIKSYDHWVASGILAAIGLKMLIESFKIKNTQKNFNPCNIHILLFLSIATSIDALAVGISLSLITSSIALAVLIIGLTTFFFSFIGVFIGKFFGHFFESKIEAAGGIVLIGIALKILFQHLYQ
jgi:manganese efflux pump family protein